MTLSMIAEKVGASVSTVSKAFSGSREISEEMRERIFAVARARGCFEKYYKGPRRSRLTAVLLPELESEYYAGALGALERECRARGGDIVVAMTRFDASLAAKLYYEMAYRMRVDGVILFGDGKMIENPNAAPLVLLSSRAESSRYPMNTVEFLMEEGMASVIRHLKERGHRRVGFIGEPLTLVKEALFRRELRMAGLAVEDRLIVKSDCRFESGGYAGMKELLSRGAPPSAVVAAYDYLAIGAIRCAREHGFSVPHDISFVGADDIAGLPYLDPPLTSMRFDIAAAAPAVFDLLERMSENPHYRGRETITVPFYLTERESVRDLRNPS